MHEIDSLSNLPLTRSEVLENRARIKELVARIYDDTMEVPAEAKEKIEFVFLQDVDEAVRAVLEPRRDSREPGV
jgi:hypothetical protein